MSDGKQLTIKDINKETLIYTEEKPETKKEITSKIPYGYVEVTLETLGLLNAPKRIHVKNYTIEHLMELAEVKEEDFLDKLVEILNELIYEDIDCNLFHEEDIKKILLVIYNTFWSTTLKMPYYYNEKKTTPNKNQTMKDIIGEANVPIKNINTKPIDTKVKNPIKIKIQNEVVKFIFPYIGMGIKAKQFIKDKYLAEERKFSNFKLKYQEYQALLNKKKWDEIEKLNLDTQEIEAYENYMKKRNFDLIRALTNQVIYEIDGKKLETIEEKFNTQIDSKFWLAWQKVIEDYSFGINSNVKFTCSKTNKEIERRFQFRPMDFIPNYDNPNNSQYDISFGD